MRFPTLAFSAVLAAIPATASAQTAATAPADPRVGLVTHPCARRKEPAGGELGNKLERCDDLQNIITRAQRAFLPTDKQIAREQPTLGRFIQAYMVGTVTRRVNHLKAIVLRFYHGSIG